MGYEIKSYSHSLEGAKEVVFDHSLREIKTQNPFDEKGQIIDYDLFPYKIKNREQFYQRDHPKNINPSSFSFKLYWEGLGKKFIEGEWIDDNGTWVYMMPKLHFFINYVTIIGNVEGDETRRTEIQPDLSSLEWIQASYVLTIDGFSGFADDEQYTSNGLVKKLVDGISLSKYEQKKLDKCYSPNGQLKVYVDPWEYLTRFYLIDNPADKPLGDCLYENNLKNALVAGARGCAKSIYAYSADFLHSWLFGTVKKWEDRQQCSLKNLFAAAAVSKDPLNRSMKLIKNFYDSQPGKYRYEGSNRPDFMGPFYKKAQGAWSAGSEVSHIVKNKNNTLEVGGSSFQMNVITRDKTRVAAGDRFLRIYVEEAGLLAYLDQVHSTNKDSMEVGEVKVGSAYYTGCVCKGTKVLTSDGLYKSIENLYEIEGIVGVDDKYEPQSDNISRMWPSYTKPCYRLEFQSGKSLHLSEDHPIFSRRKYKSGVHRKKAYWEQAQYLKEGDFVAVPEKIDIWSDLTIENARLIGLLIGDGTYGEGQNVRLINKDEDVWNYVESICEVKYRSIDDSGLRKGRLLGLRNLLKDFGIYGQTSVNKKLPQAAFYSRKEDLCELIGGMFDADGCVSISKNNYVTIKYTSISIVLIEGLQLLLNKLGIHGKIINQGPGPKGKFDCYSLIIKDSLSIKNFYGNIKFLVKYKQENLQKAYDLKKSVKPKKINTYKNLVWDKITNVEFIGEQYVYNLTAEKNHTYIANGIITHNTAGDLEAIEPMKKMMLNPRGYQITGIPNYWKNNDSKIGLFLSAMYKYRNFKDKNGNNDLQASSDYVQQDRLQAFKDMDSQAFDDHILNNPINPDEMLRPNRRSFLPVSKAQKRLADIEDYKYDILNTTVGDIRWNKAQEYGVEFVKDLNGKYTPITDFNIDRKRMDISGAYQIYEHPPEYIPENLFWVIFDPVSKPGKGQSLDASLNAAIVYKGHYTGRENTLEDSIVADWVGRLDSLEDTYEQVIKLAKYYNAKIFPETNTPGFVDYCKREGHYHMLQAEAYHAEKELNPNYRKRGAVGFSMYGTDKKVYLLQWLRSWLLKKRNHNKETGEFDSINMDHLLPKRLLNEIINFNEDKGNYDYISCMLGLMLLLVDIKEEAPVELFKKEDIWEPEVNYNSRKSTRRRSTFENLVSG